MRRHILNNKGNKEEANDILQEALIILCRKVNDLDFVLTSSLDTYIFGIAKMLWRSELCKKNHQTAWSEFANAGDNEIEVLINQENNYKLAEKALNSISDICIRILELFYIKKESMSSIAVALGHSSENAAKTQKYKCLEKARQVYTELINQTNS